MKKVLAFFGLVTVKEYNSVVTSYDQVIKMIYDSESIHVIKDGKIIDGGEFFNAKFFMFDGALKNTAITDDTTSTVVFSPYNNTGSIEITNNTIDHKS